MFTMWNTHQRIANTKTLITYLLMQKTKKPEKIVEAEVLTWLNINGFSADVIDSKATYSSAAGRYMNSMAPVGFLDIVATDPIGRACYIELKAKGKRNNVSIGQYVFAMQKIDHFAFVVVVDSASSLEYYYKAYCEYIKIGDFKGSMAFLKSIMPTNSTIAELDKPLDLS